MKCRCLIGVAAALIPLAAALAEPVGTAFTYQGQLKTSGSPATGSFDLQFKLFDSQSAGAQIGQSFTVPNASVVGGLFTSKLDFGLPAFEGSKRWLEISLKPAGAGSYTTLTPRQELTPTPYAIAADTVELPLFQTGSSGFGLGTSGLFHIFQEGAGHAIVGQTNSTGAGIFGLCTSLTGAAAKFWNLNASSSEPAVEVTNSGSGWGLVATSNLGRAGSFEITNAANPNIAMYAMTNGTGHAVQGYATGNGKGVGGYNNGFGQAGYFRIGNNANSSEAVYIETIGPGKALSVRSIDGPAVYARVSGDGPAIQTDGGGLKVTGAGVASNTWVYIHQANASNVSGTRTYLNNSACNGNPSAIILVTNAFNGGGLYPHGVAVGYDTGNARWYLHCLDNEDMSTAVRFNVMIVLP